MNFNRFIFMTLVSAVAIAAAPSASAVDAANLRAERRYLREGNKLYNERRFSEAETMYKKALESNAASEAASYNLATTYLRQATPGESGKKLIGEAQTLLTDVLRSAQNAAIAEKAAYNLGNLAFNNQQWDQSINYYKEALRRNPDNDKARENLRLAQLKKREQQQDKNQDQNKDQDQQKDQQDQNKDQQNQDKQNQQNQPNQPQDKKQPPKPQGQMSQENAEKILKAMENEEAATRRRIQEAEKKNGTPTKRIVGKPW